MPIKVKYMQAFLDFANFYCRFIKDFAKIVILLTILIRKDVSQKWGLKQIAAFEALKQAFTTAPILRIPDDENKFKLSTNASNFTISTVLFQLNSVNNLYHPIAFYSKLLNIYK